MRLVVHISSFLAAALFSFGPGSPGGGLLSGGIAFSVYIGLICLIPRGISAKPDWLIPGGLGLFQTAFWAVWGVPWQFCIIWGGALTWMIRLLMKRARMGWEWAVLPWLVVCLYSFFAEMLPLSPARPPYWTFPLLAVAGWAALRLYGRLRGDAEVRAMLVKACERLDALTAPEALTAPDALPEDLAPQAVQFARQSRRLLELRPNPGEAGAELVREIATAAERLSRTGPSAGPAVRASLRTTLARVNKTLQKSLAAIAPRQEGGAALDPALAKKLEEYRELSLRLTEKSADLPLELRGHVDGIARATENILVCMRDDPRDIAPGDRFLARYLKAAHTVADEHIRLAGQGVSSRTVDEALGRSRELLQRLEKAFTEEHAALLENDTINFTAELNVLDKLLKMDGR